MREKSPLHSRIPTPEQFFMSQEHEMSDGEREALEFAKSIGTIGGEQTDKKRVIKDDVRPKIMHRVRI